MKEINLKRAFRELWDGWCGAYEFGMGGDAGAPDLQVLVGHPPWLLPIELKRGDLVNGIVKPDRVRPAQIEWHATFQRFGGRSIMVIGLNPWNCAFYVVPASLIPKWKDGYAVNEQAHRLNPVVDGLGLKGELVQWLGRKLK